MAIKMMSPSIASFDVIGVGNDMIGHVLNTAWWIDKMHRAVKYG